MALRRWMVKKYDEDMRENASTVPGPFPLVLVLDHLKGRFNVPKIIRTANALGCREVHLVGVPRFDPSPARGALRYTPVKMFDKFADCHRDLAGQGYKLYALAVEGSALLGSEAFPERTALVVGHEEFGLSFSAAEFPDVTALRIPQFGKVQSLNVAVAASVACFEWVRQHGAAPAAGAV